jgi:hypothetical protein
LFQLRATGMPRDGPCTFGVAKWSCRSASVAESACLSEASRSRILLTSSVLSFAC